MTKHLTGKHEGGREDSFQQMISERQHTMAAGARAIDGGRVFRLEEGRVPLILQPHPLGTHFL